MITTTQYTYVDGPPPLNISYVNPKQTKQDLLESTVDKSTI